MTRIVLGFLILCALPQEDPNLKYLPERGFAISKPPKKDEWQFKDKGRFQMSQAIILNVVDDMSIEMYSQVLDNNKLGYDPKLTLENLWTQTSSNGMYKDVKMVGKIAATTLPNRGAGGQRVWLLDMTLTTDGGPMEWKAYCFSSNENRGAYLIYVYSKQGLYAKHKADVEYMLGSVKCYKLPK